MPNTPAEVDVVVVGAGVTGLTTATRLKAAGLSVLVIEARDKVGGRLWTETIDSVRVELGGQWVAADQDRVLAVLDELGIETFARYRSGSSVYIDLDGQRRLFQGGTLPVPEGTAREIDRVVAILDQLAAAMDPAAPWAHPEADELDSITFDAWLAAQTDDREARDNIASCAGPAMLTKPAHSFSALAALALAASVGSFTDLTDENVVLDLRVAGGLAQIPLGLAADLGDAVLLSSPVERIDWAADGAAVLASGRIHRARRVVIATPPHVVRKIRISPALPPRHLQLRDQQSIGVVIKVNAVYRTPFWRCAGLSGTALSPYQLVHEVYDNTNDDLGDERGVLVGFVSDVNADRLDALSPDERRKAVLASLAAYFGDEALDPIAYSESPWLADEWIGGAYGTSFDVGSLVRYGRFVHEPVGPLSFGSSDVLGPGYLHVDGGIRIGERLAASILQELSSASDVGMDGV